MRLLGTEHDAANMQIMMSAPDVMTWAVGAMDVWLETPGVDLSGQVARAIDLLASGLTDGA